MSIKKIKWEPPFKAIGETDSLEHLREMLRFHGNARVNLMEDLKKIIMICKDYEFDLKIHGHGGSSSSGHAYGLFKEIEEIATKAYKEGAYRKKNV
jgi:hypothetical protein